MVFDISFFDILKLCFSAEPFSKVLVVAFLGTLLQRKVYKSRGNISNLDIITLAEARHARRKLAGKAQR